MVCLAVNDPFEMETWGQEQHAQRIYFLPDGNGEFRQGMGMLVDKSEIGLGKRSWRYWVSQTPYRSEKARLAPNPANAAAKLLRSQF